MAPEVHHTSVEVKSGPLLFEITNSALSMYQCARPSQYTYFSSLVFSVVLFCIKLAFHKWRFRIFEEKKTVHKIIKNHQWCIFSLFKVFPLSVWHFVRVTFCPCDIFSVTFFPSYILSCDYLSVWHFVRHILSVTLCPCGIFSVWHFVLWHFVRNILS